MKELHYKIDISITAVFPGSMLDTLLYLMNTFTVVRHDAAFFVRPNTLM